MTAPPPERAIDLAPGGCQAHDRSATRTSNRPRAWRVPGACALHHPDEQSTSRLAGARRMTAPPPGRAIDLAPGGCQAHVRAVTPLHNQPCAWRVPSARPLPNPAAPTTCAWRVPGARSLRDHAEHTARRLADHAPCPRGTMPSCRTRGRAGAANRSLTQDRATTVAARRTHTNSPCPPAAIRCRRANGVACRARLGRVEQHQAHHRSFATQPRCRMPVLVALPPARRAASDNAGGAGVPIWRPKPTRHSDPAHR